MTITLNERLMAVQAAKEAAESVAERWLAAKASGHMTDELEAEMTEAERNIVRAERRFEKTAKKMARS